MQLRKEKDRVVLFMTTRDLEDPVTTSRLLEELLIVECEKRIVADLGGIDHMHSMQVGTLVMMHVLCYENVAVMTLARVNERVKQLLRMVGLDSMMEIHHGAAVARESLGPVGSV